MNGSTVLSKLAVTRHLPFGLNVVFKIELSWDRIYSGLTSGRLLSISVNIFRVKSLFLLTISGCAVKGNASNSVPSVLAFTIWALKPISSSFLFVLT